MPDTIISVEGVTKDFGDVHALKGIDLQVEAGTVFGLLGPNGAGKTTLIRILATLLLPTTGKATVDGLDVVRDAEELRFRIGLAGQSAAVDENLTGLENLEMVGRLYHLPKDVAHTRGGDVLERFGLSDAADRAAKTYSGGMRRRLDLAASLVGRPRSCSSMSPPPDWTRGAGSTSGTSCASSSRTAPPCSSPRNTWRRRISSRTASR